MFTEPIIFKKCTLIVSICWIIGINLKNKRFVGHWRVSQFPFFLLCLCWIEIWGKRDGKCQKFKLVISYHPNSQHDSKITDKMSAGVNNGRALVLQYTLPSSVPWVTYYTLKLITITSRNSVNNIWVVDLTGRFTNLYQHSSDKVAIGLSFIDLRIV